MAPALSGPHLTCSFYLPGQISPEKPVSSPLRPSEAPPALFLPARACFGTSGAAVSIFLQGVIPRIMKFKRFLLLNLFFLGSGGWCLATVRVSAVWTGRPLSVPSGPCLAAVSAAGSGSVSASVSVSASWSWSAPWAPAAPLLLWGFCRAGVRVRLWWRLRGRAGASGACASFLRIGPARLRLAQTGRAGPAICCRPSGPCSTVFGVFSGIRGVPGVRVVGC